MSDLELAALEVARIFGSEEMGSAVGTHMTCTEADALAALLLVVGDVGGSRAFLRGHAEEDDEGDRHFHMRGDRR